MIQLKYSKIIIIGSGPSGYTSSLYISRANLNPILITGVNIGGQLNNTSEVENWPAKIKISGTSLMQKFFLQVKNTNIEINFNELYKFNLLFKPIILFSKLHIYFCEIKIISMGSSAKFLSLFNERFYLGKNISTCSICDGSFYKDKIVAIVGGGSSSVENAVYLKNICKKIYLINKNKSFICDFTLLKKLFYKVNFLKISLKLNSIIIELIGDKNLINYIKVKNIYNNLINLVFINGLFISIGHIPNTKFFLGQLSIKNNYIKTNWSSNFTCTNLPGVFVSGDIKDPVYKQAIIGSGFGAVAAFDSNFYLNKLT